MNNKTDKALRYDDNKLRFDLIPQEALIELTKVYTSGAKKYADHNWRKGMEWSRCIASLKRHLVKWEMGLTEDPETNTHHLAQVAWNALTLFVYELQGLGEDDRNIPEKVTVDENLNWVNKTETPGSGRMVCAPSMSLEETFSPIAYKKPKSQI